MEQDLKTKVSKYMSYLLRHDPENLKMDLYGFLDLDRLLEKLNERFNVDKKLIYEIVEQSCRIRFEIVENKIRALYGHTIPVRLELEEDKVGNVFYHGTTPNAASKILKVGLKPMKRRWAHLSPTAEIATEVGLRKTKNPVILEIDVQAARNDGLVFYKATDEVYLCRNVATKYVRLADPSKTSKKHQNAITKLAGKHAAIFIA
jgi:putative RNA 2'-phosphotransferase